jgi:hypothetical protein
MPYEIEFFARVDNRLILVVGYVSLITIGMQTRGRFTETDIFLYRYRHQCHSCSSGKFEIVRFHPEQKYMAQKFFPHGPPPHDHVTSAWIETTDWLEGIAKMTLPVRDNNRLRRVDNHPRKLPPHFALLNGH